MAAPDILIYVMNSLIGVGGNKFLVGLAILAFFVIAFMFAGMDFRYALIICIPLIMGLTGLFLSSTASGLLFIGIIAFGGYLAWSYFTERV